MQIEMPKDGWGQRNGAPIIPRRWQAEAIDVIIKHYSQSNPSRGVIHAVTGSGKSVVISTLCACIKPERDEVIVVSTSRQSLVRQIRQTIKDRLESDEFMAEEVVGSYWSGSKDTDNRIIVCCNNSMKNLAEALAKKGRPCLYWIADELHRTQSPSMLAAFSTLTPMHSIGFSATPFRANPKQGISSFDSVLYKYTVADALADKTVVVPWKIINWEGGETSLDNACLEMLKEAGGRAIVNAMSIADAEEFSKFCTDNGYLTKAVHSKLSNSEIDAILEAMKSGEIQAVCYPDLLSEGVDIPEILVVCLRRQVASRNRFVQELGRGIRYYKNKETGEEKTHLTVLDPGDLMSRFRLTYEAVLSGDYDPEDDQEEESEGQKLERALQQECFEVLRHVSRVRAGKEPLNFEPLATYLSQLCSVFDTFGLMEKPLNSRDWRTAPSSEKQITTMSNLKWALGRAQVPSIHRTALETLTTVGKMNRGMASDLISIEMSLAEKSTWPKFSQLDQCVKDGLERHEKRKLRPKTAPRAVLQTPQGPKLEQGLLFDGMTRK